MGENSKIEWCHHTMNPWRGCTKLSAGCKNCYALTMSKRNPGTLGIWGPRGTRVIAAESYWKLPIKWNKDAEAAGERRRVFCASLADVFEGNETMPKDSWAPVAAARSRLFDLIDVTPHLDWLLLTKRPHNVKPMLIEAGRSFQDLPPNVWIGTSVENQQTADERIPHLLSIPAHVRFLSCEPLLGPLDLTRYLSGGYVSMQGGKLMPMNVPLKDLHWVIAGGESGNGKDIRPMHPDWARSLRDQCVAAGVAFHFKQWGEWAPMVSNSVVFPEKGRTTDWNHRDYFFRDGTTIRGRFAWHTFNGHASDYQQVIRFGKAKTGRLLDGRTWDELPTPRSPRIEVPQ
jgi:protein gp37